MGGWGKLYPSFVLDFWNLFYFAKPLSTSRTECTRLITNYNRGEDIPLSSACLAIASIPQPYALLRKSVHVEDVSLLQNPAF